MNQMPTLLDVDAVLERVAAALADKFSGVFNPETISRYVNESYVALYRTARLDHHLPALTERFATDRLTALAQAKGAIGKPVPEVLFLCVHNAGRSQMAAALLAHHAQGRVNVRSAGSAPGATVSASAATVLAEVGIDLDDAFPKPLTDDVLRAADVVVTMGCGDACPVISGTRYLDWNLADPAGNDLDTVRAVRDDIDTRVRALLADLTDHHTDR
ncbi:three-helix bundle dimerization domain-containing protein [Micromonospora sp. URMC 107]|uniref:arsenate reductase/protein-tyrosine-phosphatase family protein n=1 Tax=Micromonospora sp. URMC 107 TaxID=3423418 RepID=UPI003F1BBE55